MFIPILSRRVVVLSLVALVSGCSSTKTNPEASSSNVTAAKPASVQAGGDACKSNRSKCLYEGAYDAGERKYAEQEAKRLNLAEYERLRRAFSK